MLGVCLLCFGVTSAIDPGTVTKENQEFYQALYPYDDVTNTEKECNTCHVSKPARSKHCRICKRYVTTHAQMPRLIVDNNAVDTNAGSRLLLKSWGMHATLLCSQFNLSAAMQVHSAI